MATKAKTSRATGKANKYGVNQYTPPDPRQALCLTHYLDPKSPTFSNMLQSALKAGYAQEYAENLMSLLPDWLSDRIGESAMLLKAERNLDEVLDLETNLPVIGMFGPIYERIPNGRDKKGKEKFKRGKLVMAENHKLLSIKADVTKFVAERIGRKKYGPKASPAPIYNFAFFSDEQLRRIATRAVNGDTTSETQPD